MRSGWYAATGVLTLGLALKVFFPRHVAPESPPSTASSSEVSKAVVPVAEAPAVAPVAALSGFPQMEEEAWKQIDLAASTRPDPRDAEGLPRELAPVVAVMGKIATSLRSDPSLVQEGIAFYRQCAARDSDLFSIRAVCLRDLKYWENRTGAHDDSDEVPVSPEIARIVKMLPAAR